MSGVTRPDQATRSWDGCGEPWLLSAYDGRVETRPDTGPSASGYVIVLLGVAGFVVGCFLPYLSGNLLPGEGTVSLFRLIWLGAEKPIEQVGVLLQVFAGAATVGVIALLGIGRRRAWTPHALIAGAAAWTLTWIGVLIGQTAFGSYEVGYWVLLASMGVAIIGTVVVWVSARAHAREPTTGLPRWRLRAPPHATSLHLHHPQWSSGRHHPHVRSGIVSASRAHAHR